MATDRENYISNNNIITLHRGDTFSIQITASSVNENDKVYFGFMEPNQRWEDALMKKIVIVPARNDNTAADYTATFTFSSADTENILPGKYYYEIKLVRFDQIVATQIDSVETLQGKKIFYII